MLFLYLCLLFSYIPMFTNCFYQNVFVLNEACFPDAGSLDRVGAVLCMQPDGRSACYHCHYRRCGQSGYKDLIKHFLGAKHLRQISCSVRLSLLPMSDKTFSPLIAFCSSEHFFNVFLYFFEKVIRGASHGLKKYSVESASLRLLQTSLTSLDQAKDHRAPFFIKDIDYSKEKFVLRHRCQRDLGLFHHKDPQVPG